MSFWKNRAPWPHVGTGLVSGQGRIKGDKSLKGEEELDQSTRLLKLCFPLAVINGGIPKGCFLSFKEQGMSPFAFLKDDPLAV